jgi:hypothetical protein
MFQLPILYSNVVNAVNKAAKSPQSAHLLAILGGTTNVAAVLFVVMQSYLAFLNKDKSWWIARIESSLKVVSGMQATWHQMCVDIIANLKA